MFARLIVTVDATERSAATERRYTLSPGAETSVRTDGSTTRIFVSRLVERDAPFIVDVRNSVVTATADAFAVSGKVGRHDAPAEVRLDRP